MNKLTGMSLWFLLGLKIFAQGQNDPGFSQQYYIHNIKADSAWTLTKGDSNIVVAVIDVAFELDHEDLAGQWYYNTADTIDGIDNDGNGYVDDYLGWDFGDTDNTVSIDTNPPGGLDVTHGTKVAGCIAAIVNNSIGITGVAPGVKILPIKISNSSGLLVKVYDAIKYAADMGADIINLSLGQPTLPIASEQDVINYATFQKNALVVSATANDDKEIIRYPGGYNNVLCVAGTDQTDTKWYTSPGFGSNYNYGADICAPAKDIYTTKPGNLYGTVSGTSFATPIVAACAALVKSYYNSIGQPLTALQIAEKLRATADDVDSLNPLYAGKLGAGRVNVYNALTQKTPSVRLVNAIMNNMTADTLLWNKIPYSLNYLNTIEAKVGDTLSFEGWYVDYLDTINNLSVTMEFNKSYLRLLNNTIPAGNVNTLDTFKQKPNPFIFVVDSLPASSNLVLFTLHYTDGLSYSAKESFQFWVQKLVPNFIAEPFSSVSQLVCYPNPSTGEFTVNFSLRTTETLSIRITDLYGINVQDVIRDRIFVSGQHEVKIAENFSSGMYFINLSSSSGTLSTKIFIKK